jgi:hypothetical protein
MDIFKNIFYILPVLMYYFVESIIIGFFIYLLWIFSLQQLFFNFKIGYIEWVFIIFCIKAIFFDVFKLLAGLNLPIQQTQENDNTNEQNNTNAYSSQ